MDTVREARMALVESAHVASSYASFNDWRDYMAPQWALDRVSDRELNAIYGLYWEPRKGKSFGDMRRM